MNFTLQEQCSDSLVKVLDGSHADFERAQDGVLYLRRVFGTKSGGDQMQQFATEKVD